MNIKWMMPFLWICRNSRFSPWRLFPLVFWSTLEAWSALALSNCWTGYITLVSWAHTQRWSFRSFQVLSSGVKELLWPRVLCDCPVLLHSAISWCHHPFSPVCWTACRPRGDILTLVSLQVRWMPYFGDLPLEGKYLIGYVCDGVLTVQVTLSWSHLFFWKITRTSPVPQTHYSHWYMF